jgi:hypothetical protein
MAMLLGIIYGTKQLFAIDSTIGKREQIKLNMKFGMVNGH